MMESNKPFTCKEAALAYEELERSVFAALETYSNVHRGSGHWSMVSTYLYEQAREIVLEYLGLDKGSYTVIFCSPLVAGRFRAKLKPGCFSILSSNDFGLPLGVRAVAVRKEDLPKGAPFQTGGGTARLVGPDWILWAGNPDKFEAGTPAVINVIAFAKALQMIRKSGNEIFKSPPHEPLTASGIIYEDAFTGITGTDLLEKLRETMIGRSLPVPTLAGLRPFVNLDNSASTPALLPVWEAARLTWRQSAETQQEVIRETRAIISGFLEAPPATYDVIFTTNTTGAVNLVADCFGRGHAPGYEPVILTTLLEHSSNDLPWRALPNCTMVRMTFDEEGFLDLAMMEEILRSYNREFRYGNKRITLVAVSGASNVLGSVNDIFAISRIVHHYGARLLVDAAQLVAHRRIRMEACGIDYLAFSAHKVYAPFGTGVLAARKGLLDIDPGGMEQIRSSGEENVTGIAALGKALLLMRRVGMDVIREQERSITEKALSEMSKVKGLTIFGVSGAGSTMFHNKIGVIAFNMKAAMANVVARELALRGGIGIRSGCHCAHGLVKHLAGLGPRLERVQKVIVILLPGLTLPGVARVSFGIGNTEDEVARLVEVLSEIADKRNTRDRPGEPVISKAEAKRKTDEFVRQAAKKVYS